MLHDEAESEKNERHQPDGLRQGHIMLHLLLLGVRCGQGINHGGVSVRPLFITELLWFGIREHVPYAHVNCPHADIGWQFLEAVCRLPVETKRGAALRLRWILIGEVQNLSFQICDSRYGKQEQQKSCHGDNVVKQHRLNPRVFHDFRSLSQSGRRISEHVSFR